MGSLFGGGGGGGAAAPDPQWSENAKEGQRIGLQAARQALGIADDEQDTSAALGRFAVGAGLRGYGQMQDYIDYVGRQRQAYQGLTDRALRDADEFNSADWQGRYAQQAGEDVTLANQRALDTASRQMAGLGLRPGSGAYADMIYRNSLAGAMGSAQAQNMAREAARQLGLQYQDRASGMVANGANLFGSLGSGLVGAGINAGVAPLTAQGTALNTRIAPYTAAGGLGSGVSNASANMYNANANFNLGDAKLKQSAGSPLGSLAGMAAGMLGSGVFSSLGSAAAGAIGTYFGGPAGGAAAQKLYSSILGGGK